jgi:hypothetical protein
MQFVYPYFLYSLFALSIPIIVHLFNFRRFKRIYFSNITFLKEINQDTKSVQNLKHLLILLCRLLALFFLIMAFAQPYISASNKEIIGGTNGVSIYIDNSYSSGVKGKNGILLEEAKIKAKEIAQSFKASDKFHLLTNDFEGKHQRLVNKEEFIKMVNDVTLSSVSKKLEQVNLRQKDALSLSSFQNKHQFIISDFQVNQSDFSNLKNDTSINTSLIRLIPNKDANVYIDSAWFESPFHQQNGKEKVFVKLKSSSQGNSGFENIPVKLLINNAQKSLASISLEANDEKIVELEFTNTGAGFQKGIIKIQDASILFDDELHFSYEIKNKIKIINIFQKSSSSNISKVYKTDEYFDFTEKEILSINYSQLKEHDLIILNNLKDISTGMAQELSKLMAAGKSIFCFIPMEAEIDSYNKFFNSLNSFQIQSFDSSKIKTDKINFNHSLYSDIFEKDKLKNQNIDYPSASGRFLISNAQRSGSISLIDFLDRSPLLSIQTKGKGKFYTAFVPADTKYSNFIVHPLFVPTMYKVAMMSARSRNNYYTLGNTEGIILEGKEISGDEQILISNLDEKSEFIPSSKIIDGNTLLLMHGQPTKAGNYSLTINKEIQNFLSFNFPRSESLQEFYSDSELIDNLEKNNLNNFTLLNNSGKPIKQQISELVEGKKYWKQCLWLSLIFLLLEIIVLNLKIKPVKPKTN